MYLAACMEWLFAAEHPHFPDRIRDAEDAGLKAGEFHLWPDKPLDETRRALDETDVELSSFVVEPRRALVDPAQHEECLAAVHDSLEAADRAGTGTLVVASGFLRDDVSCADHHAAAVDVLRCAADLAEKTAVTLVLEPLTTKVEHPGMYLDSTAEGLDMVAEVGSPHLRLLYDMYQSTVMDEVPAQVLAGRFDLVAHVQVADVPGRHEPGSGVIDRPAYVQTLRDLGYAGAVGLEYKPTGPTPETLSRAPAALGL